MNTTKTTITVKVTVPEGLYIPNQPHDHDPEDPFSVSAELARIIEEALIDIGASVNHIGASDIYRITQYK